jgi:hypothetical protein
MTDLENHRKYVARNIKSNANGARGAIISLIAQSSLTKKK